MKVTYIWTVKTSDPALVEFHESREGWETSDYTLEYASDVPKIIEEIKAENAVDGFQVVTDVAYVTDRTMMIRSYHVWDNSTRNR